MSARILGEKFGLTSEQMNYVLKLAGLLEGEPGAWSITEKGAKFAAEQHHHRGTGGYSWYNRSWDTVTWDESVAPAVEAAVDLSDDGLKRIRQTISELRRARRVANAAVAGMDHATRTTTLDHVGGHGRTGGFGSSKAVGALLTTATAYAVVRAAPLVRRALNDRRAAG